MVNFLSTAITNHGIYLRIHDIIDILLVAYIMYKGLQLISETRAVPLLKGIVFLVIFMQISAWFNFHTINYVLSNTLQIGVIALVIIFQPELRRALERLGQNNLGKIFAQNSGKSDYSPVAVSAEISQAVEYLAKNRTGALIVLEGQTKLADIVHSGILLQSVVSAELIANIFTPNTPLHDGAVVIRKDQVVAASCLLPLTHNRNLSIELGTRHRAALGISETSDSTVIIVSEETGKISIAQGSRLTRSLTPESLERKLIKILNPEPDFPIKPMKRKKQETVSK